MPHGTWPSSVSSRGRWHSDRRLFGRLKRSSTSTASPWPCFPWAVHISDWVIPHERSRQLAETRDYPFYLPWASARLGAAYLLAGRVGDSLALLKRTIEIDAARTAQAEISLWCGWLAEAYRAHGQPEEARALARRALDLAVSDGERGHQGWALRLQAEFAAEMTSPELDTAKTLYEQALTLARELEMRPLQAHCHFGLGKVSQQTGKDMQAQDQLTSAMTMYRDMGMTYWLERVEAEMRELG